MKVKIMAAMIVSILLISACTQDNKDVNALAINDEWGGKAEEKNLYVQHHITNPDIDLETGITDFINTEDDVYVLNSQIRTM